MKLKWSLALFPPGIILVAWVVVHFYWWDVGAVTFPSLIDVSSLKLERGILEIRSQNLTFDSFKSYIQGSSSFYTATGRYSDPTFIIPRPKQPTVIESFCGRLQLSGGSTPTSTGSVFGFEWVIPIWILFLISITPVTIMWIRRKRALRLEKME